MQISMRIRHVSPLTHWQIHRYLNTPTNTTDTHLQVHRHTDIRTHTNFLDTQIHIHTDIQKKIQYFSTFYIGTFRGICGWTKFASKRKEIQKISEILYWNERTKTALSSWKHKNAISEIFSDANRKNFASIIRKGFPLTASPLHSHPLHSHPLIMQWYIFCRFSYCFTT